MDNFRGESDNLPRGDELEFDAEKSEDAMGMEMDSWVVDELRFDLSSSTSDQDIVEGSLDLGQSSKKWRRGCSSGSRPPPGSTVL
eukprot:Gb_20436 [translate_table: standard]